MFKQFARRIATVRCYATKECASVEDFKSVVAQGKGLTIVDFYANWCGPCKMLTPVLEKVADEKNVTLLKVNVDELPELAEQHDVTGIPAVFFYNNNAQVDKFVGFQQKDKIVAIVEKHSKL